MNIEVKRLFFNLEEAFKSFLSCNGFKEASQFEKLRWIVMYPIILVAFIWFKLLVFLDKKDKE